MVKCSYCKGEINSKTSYYYEHATQNAYHIKCLTCHRCKLDCSKEFYHTSKKINRHYLPVIYCKNDMFETCGICQGPIELGGQVTFLGTKYHEEHFTCSVCGCGLSQCAQVFELRRALYCAKDFVAYYRGACAALRHTPRVLDLDFDDVSDPAVAHFAPDNLDIRDFTSTDYATVYCGGCDLMLLAGSNIKDIRFNDSGEREYWHLDCFSMLRRYRVILSPKFVDPRRYIMFNQNSRSINMTAELKHLLQCLDAYFSRLEKYFGDLDEIEPKRTLLGLVLLIEVLFKAVEVVDFVMDDYKATARDYKYPGEGNKLEELNFLRFQTLGGEHISLHGLFVQLLEKELDGPTFREELIRKVDHIVGYALHQALIYNYLTKENYLLRTFLDKLSESERSRDVRSEESSRLVISDVSHHSEDEDCICSKCGDAIGLESCILQIFEDSSTVSKKFWFHMNCVVPGDLIDSVSVVKITDAYANEEEEEGIGGVDTREVGVLERVIYSMRRLLS